MKYLKNDCVSESEYLEAEETASVRHEFVDGYRFEMTGSTEAHSLICANILAFLHAKLRGHQCRASAHGLKVKVAAANSIYYPDVLVNCAPFVAGAIVVETPSLIVEVLSPSTAGTDRREKLISYKKLESLKEYLIVFQDRQQVELHRKLDDGKWLSAQFHAGDDLTLESLPIGQTKLPFATIYDGYNPPTRVKEEELDYLLSDL